MLTLWDSWALLKEGPFTDFDLVVPFILEALENFDLKTC
jgi:hypothetical protein